MKEKNKKTQVRVDMGKKSRSLKMLPRTPRVYITGFLWPTCQR